MSASLTSSGDRRLLVAAAGAALLLTILSISFADRNAAQNMPTTYSPASAGARAAYQVLEAAGYQVQRWEQPIAELPPASAATLMLAQPEGNASAAEIDALRRFVRTGGRVIATGPTGAAFLGQAAVAEPVEAMTWQRVDASYPSSVTRAATQITLAPESYWSGVGLALTLYGGDRHPRVVRYGLGRGDVIWWASATPLTNAGLREPGNLEFLLACIGDTRRPVLWDEYVHGHGRSGPAGSSVRSPLRWLVAQLVLAAAAVVITFSRRAGPTIAAPAENRLSPLEFVRTLGALYHRAGNAATAVDITFQHFRYRVTRALGAPPDMAAADLAGAVRDRWRLKDRSVDDLLQECESARGSADLSPRAALRLVQSLSDWTAKLQL